MKNKLYNNIDQQLYDNECNLQEIKDGLAKYFDLKDCFEGLSFGKFTNNNSDWDAIIRGWNIGMKQTNQKYKEKRHDEIEYVPKRAKCNPLWKKCWNEYNESFEAFEKCVNGSGSGEPASNPA